MHAEAELPSLSHPYIERSRSRDQQKKVRQTKSTQSLVVHAGMREQDAVLLKLLLLDALIARFHCPHRFLAQMQTHPAEYFLPAHASAVRQRSSPLAPVVQRDGLYKRKGKRERKSVRSLLIRNELNEIKKSRELQTTNK